MFRTFRNEHPYTRLPRDKFRYCSPNWVFFSIYFNHRVNIIYISIYMSSLTAEWVTQDVNLLGFCKSRGLFIGVVFKSFVFFSYFCFFSLHRIAQSQYLTHVNWMRFTCAEVPMLSHVVNEFPSRRNFRSTNLFSRVSHSPSKFVLLAFPFFLLGFLCTSVFSHVH